MKDENRFDLDKWKGQNLLGYALMMAREQFRLGKDMASSKEYLTFILEQLSDLEGISYRAMMSEYIIYYREKIVGGIYDDKGNNKGKLTCDKLSVFKGLRDI